MKIKEIYTANNNFGPITLVEDNSFTRIEKFFSTRDPLLSQNYYRNKNKLKIYLLDKINFCEVDAAYTVNGNVVFMREDATTDLTHELMHMASSWINGTEIRTLKNDFFWGDELIAIEEGMAEFLSSLIDNSSIKTYGIQSFVSKMLYTTTKEGILAPFFNADGQQFIKMFKEKDIANVLLNLSVFHYNEVFGAEVDPITEEKGYAECFFDLLDGLIDIQLSQDRTQNELKKFREIFLSSLQEEIVKCEVEDFCPNYHNKVKKLIDNRIIRSV